MEDISKNKVLRLYEFLKQYNNIKNPIVSDIAYQEWKKGLDDLPKHETIVNNIYASQSEDSEEILKVKRPTLKECPKLPSELTQWVEDGWAKINNEVKVKREIKVRNEKFDKGNEYENEFIIEKFEDDKIRVTLFNQWKVQREHWVEKEKPARAADELFNTLYELYARLKKEQESLELILGDGFLLYKKDIYVDHPVILQHVKLEFNADIPEFTLTSDERGTEIYKSLFYNIEDLNSDIMKSIYDDFDKNAYSPIELENTNSFLNRLSNGLSSKGKFVENKALASNNLNTPQIYRKPVLFLRKRNLGFGIAIESIIKDINESENIPIFLKEVVGCIDENHFTNENSSELNNLNPNGTDEKILLTKPANAEQLSVAKYLEINSAVLVQGPPGTGKTHTIANMIGHLLAEGKSILVTSYSEKALSVLKDKVTENLQSLCLSLLSTTESRQEMERTLDEINENRSRLNPSILTMQIESLGKLRKQKINQLNELKLKLKNARLNEYRPIIINGEEYKPINAAKFISENKASYSWIPTPVKLGVSCSLTDEEIIELYKSNILISKEEEIEYDCMLPKLDELITPIEFHNLVSNKSKFTELNLKKYKDCWKTGNNSYKVEDLQALKVSLNKALNYIKLESEWTLATIEAGGEEVTKKSWMMLTDEIKKVYKIGLDTSEDIIKYNPEIQIDEGKIDVRSELEKIIGKLEAGGKITKLSLMLNSGEKKIINESKVNGKPPKYSNEFKALQKYYDLTKAREQLANRWNRQIANLGAIDTSSMGIDFEVTCKKYCDLIEENLSWYEKHWEPLILKLKAIGISGNVLECQVDLSANKYSRLKNIKNDLGIKLIDIINSQIYRLEYSKYEVLKQSITEVVSRYSNVQNSSILSGLQMALMNEDVEKYKESYEALVDLNNSRKDIERRRYLISKLHETAPTWATELESRKSIHGEEKPPTSLKEAWLYIQFNEEIKNRNKQSIEEIQNEINEFEKELRENTFELAFKRAWKFKLVDFNNNKSQVSSIEGWRKLIKNIGSGKGKRAEKYKAEARKLMPSCQSAVPVWIMPLSKVVENFNPSENKFDVVIIDEASQADVMALVALYLGKKVIVVGDNEQVSPLSIGEKTEEIDKLIKDYLYDVPHSVLYNGKFSIYDLAQTSGYQPIRLKEHFRCVPEIIQYSNILSYNRQIKPLRDASEVKTKPATIAYRVEGVINNNKINEKEAEAIVSLILACCENEEYKDKTFGVITLLGEKQATYIDRFLQNKMEPVEYRKRDILCGNPANFQGDERDIIFLSMVDSNVGEGPLARRGYGADDLYKKRYNVAVSRAKDQIWLIHSVDSENDLKPGDIRKDLLDYFKNPNSKDIEYENVSKVAESEFEKEVIRYLVDKGFTIVPQWQVGSYRIDMVAICNDKKVAIECDGEKWHGEEKFEEDMIRQSILERLGWRFIRIRGSEFYKNKIQTMQLVCDKLEKMDIFPCNSEAAIESVNSNSLMERVTSRAQGIRIEWENDI